MKSTAARNLSKKTVHISKLTEAACIQDTRTPAARRHATIDSFATYRSDVDAILMIRAFRETTDRVPNLYQLVEIPVSLFDSIQQAPLSVFRADAPLIPCTDSDGRVVPMLPWIDPTQR